MHLRWNVSNSSQCPLLQFNFLIISCSTDRPMTNFCHVWFNSHHPMLCMLNCDVSLQHWEMVHCGNWSKASTGFLLGFFVFNTCTCTIIQNWTSSHKNLGELLWIIYKTYSAILQNVNFIRNTVPCKANRRTRGGSWWWSNGTPSYSGDRRPPSGMFPWRRRRKSASNRRTPPDQVTPPSAMTFLCEE